MKNILIFLTFFTFFKSFSQILEPVKWTTSIEKTSDKEVILITTAIIKANWHLYSQNVPEDGPIPTTFSFAGNKNYLKKGNNLEEKGHTIHDPVFDMTIKFFEKEASFRQKIKLKSNKAFKVNASVEFMVCDDSRCLAPTEIDLIFNIK